MIKNFIQNDTAFWSLGINIALKGGIVEIEKFTEEKRANARRPISINALKALKIDLLNGLILLKSNATPGTVVEPLKKEYKEWSIMTIENGLRFSLEDALFKPAQTVFIDLDIKTVMEITQEIHSKIQEIKKLEMA